MPAESDAMEATRSPSGLRRLDKSGERIRPMFAAIAERYDRMNHLLSMNVDRYWRWWTVRKVAAHGTAPILDVCTGTGDLALAYWKATQGRVPITATDFCPEMLEIGRRKQRALGWQGNLEFREADTTELPMADDQFQIVAVAFGLRNVSDPDRGLREMLRVCQPGGRVAVLEFSLPSRQPFQFLYGWYFRHVLPKIGQLLARNDQEAYAYLPDSVGEFPQGRAMVERMQQSGLIDVHHHPLTFGIATLYVGHKPSSR
jgi:demethylmenaquinone methyltransferase/2-methoxy-6-polyprenyl-1,4-benzoquinol methylase